ncbi:hypothetical protein ACFQ22_10435 [Lentilactobacillus raoultii]|uniref:Uncharacterized protein n=1 Tax=Lentilactobacillus raoultii TaxID=1987503 RepID=A0ABW3PTQ6_9LACO|nr:hypothetical protein [Lentilactobacillus raoultii]
MKIIVLFPRTVTFLIFLVSSGIGMLVMDVVMKVNPPADLLGDWLVPNFVLAVGFGINWLRHQK